MADVDQVERYDRIAEGYSQWWAPVLAPAVRELLDRLKPAIDAGVGRLVDVGTGTGQLALGALERWPDLEIVGVDPSPEMCAAADAEADRHLPAARPRPVPDRGRLRRPSAVRRRRRWTRPSRRSCSSSSRTGHESCARRAAILRPGGHLALVTWLQDERVFIPDRVFDEVLDELGVEPGEPEVRSGDLPSVERTANELRRAGFHDVNAEMGWLAHAFSVEGYIAFMSEFDEASLFDEMESRFREQVLHRLRERLGRLTPDEMTMRFPIVFATGRR